MFEWVVQNHEVVRDLATPVVTIVVGFVAVFVQIHFNRKQSVVAEDKLKFDLFERRYAIYSAASEMVRFVTSSKEVPGEENKYLELYIQLDQAHFFFDDDVCNFIVEILTNARKLIDLLSAAEDTGEARTQLRDTHLKLSRLYTAIPLRIGPALQYSQLTR
jgi:hypothetical protein